MASKNRVPYFWLVLPGVGLFVVGACALNDWLSTVMSETLSGVMLTEFDWESGSEEIWSRENGCFRSLPKPRTTRTGRHLFASPVDSVPRLFFGKSPPFREKAAKGWATRRSIRLKSSRGRSGYPT